MSGVCINQADRLVLDFSNSLAILDVMLRTLRQSMATLPKPSMLPSITANSSRSIPSSPPYYNTKDAVEKKNPSLVAALQPDIGDVTPLCTVLPELEKGL